LIQAVVLAAGRGVRFGGDAPKQLSLLDGQSLVARAVAAAGVVGPPLVVVSDDRVAAALADVDIVRNDEPERGIASSLQAALRAVLDRHTAIAVPCDDTGDPTDVDTPADLADLETRWRSTTASE